MYRCMSPLDNSSRRQIVFSPLIYFSTELTISCSFRLVTSRCKFSRCHPATVSSTSISSRRCLHSSGASTSMNTCGNSNIICLSASRRVCKDGRLVRCHVRRKGHRDLLAFENNHVTVDLSGSAASYLDSVSACRGSRSRSARILQWTCKSA
jgi:hypothetical protein